LNRAPKRQPAARNTWRGAPPPEGITTRTVDGAAGSDHPYASCAPSGDTANAVSSAGWDGGSLRCGWPNVRIYTQHLFYGTNAGDSFLGVRETERDRARETAVDVHGRSAHALHDSGVGERSTAEPRQNDGLLRPDVIEHTEHFDLKLFDARSREDGFPDAVLAGANVLQRKNIRRAQKCRGERGGRGKQEEDTAEYHNLILG
jgi:hypothetical protein